MKFSTTMQNNLTKILTNIGLSEKEARVYLSCIEKGTAPVSEVAKGAAINRVTCYDILEKLKKKGLVSYFTKQKIKYFTATSPETLVDEYEKRSNDLRASLPQFKRLTGETNHPRIRYFEGIEGIKAIYADTLTSKSDILNFSNSHEIRHMWPEYDKEYVEKRAKKKIYLRGISPKDAEGEIVKAENKIYFREIRLIDRDQFDFSNEINIYDDKVAIISFKDELIGMIIESPEIANSQRAIFNMCWQLTDLLGKGDIKGKMMEPLNPTEIKTTILREKGELEIPPEPEIKDSNLSMF
ncbi:hypothetical protein JKY72_05365 [Candidatus Gracilibacteria bacterium]|nr:hypothetical protein [Candidatus Gracilibacteria bacterium]